LKNQTPKQLAKKSATSKSAASKSATTKSETSKSATTKSETSKSATTKSAEKGKSTTSKSAASKSATTKSETRKAATKPGGPAQLQIGCRAAKVAGSVDATVSARFFVGHLLALIRRPVCRLDKIIAVDPHVWRDVALGDDNLSTADA